MSHFLENDADCDVDDQADAEVQQPRKLVDGINLKDLLNGKDVVFTICDEYDDDANSKLPHLFDSDPEDCNISNNSERLRAIRGAPMPNLSFDVIAKSMVNLDEEGFVKKEIISSGKGAPPPDNARVLVHYNFYQEHDEKPFDSTYLRGRPCKLRLSCGEIIPGLETAIKSMRKNENSRFLIGWQVAFGSYGCPPRIRKESNILADITLINFNEIIVNAEEGTLTEKQVRSVCFESCMKDATESHYSGNEDFECGNIRSAIRNYRRCLNILHSLRISDSEEEKKMLQLKVRCLVNLAICCNKEKRFPEACVFCREVLSVDPCNIKAIFHYGKANLCLSNFDAAEKWLIKAKKMKPEDADINQELDKLYVKKKTVNMEDLRFCQRAFSTLNCNSD